MLPAGTPPPAIQDVFHQLWTDKKRNALIVNDVVRVYDEGRECLVLSERLEYLSMIQEQLRDRAGNLFNVDRRHGKEAVPDY
jgi:hypothetical protein